MSGRRDGTPVRLTPHARTRHVLQSGRGVAGLAGVATRAAASRHLALTPMAAVANAAVTAAAAAAARRDSARRAAEAARRGRLAVAEAVAEHAREGSRRCRQCSRQGLMDSARHVTRSHIFQKKRVDIAFDDVVSAFHGSLVRGHVRGG